MNLSLIMCTRNRIPELIRFNNSLLKQTLIPNEYILVDSSDIPIIENEEFKKSLKAFETKLSLKYIHSEKGLTRQRNIGVKNATGDIYFFFDDDIILESHFFEEINNTFLKFPKYMGGMGTITNEYQSQKLDGICSIFIIFSLFIYKVLHKIFLLEGGNKSGKFSISGFTNHPHGNHEFQETECLSGGLTAYRKEIFSEFQFDEIVTGYSYLEDVDFSRRVSYKHKLFYNPKAMCEHWHGEGGRGNIVENRKGFLLNYRYFYFKNIYNRNKWTIIAHWWSIFGLYFEAIFRGYLIPTKLFQYWKGYTLGLNEFARKNPK